MPASIMSAVMAESYKKYLLVSLLVHGKVPPMSKFASPVMAKHSRGTFGNYQELVNIYGTHNVEDLHKFAQQHYEFFKKENNFGLVKQCIQSLYRRNIQRYTQTYLTISIRDIVASVKLPSLADAEHHILAMIQKKELFATLNQATGMIAFHEDPEKYDNLPITQKIDQNIQTAISLVQKVKALDDHISLSSQFLQKTIGPSMDPKGMRGLANDYEEIPQYLKHM
jgi:COP9 signalosome complex subunit 3